MLGYWRLDKEGRTYKFKYCRLSEKELKNRNGESCNTKILMRHYIPQIDRLLFQKRKCPLARA